MHVPRRFTTSSVLALAASLALLGSCTASKGPSQLEIQLVDAPNPQVDQIVVNVTRVTAHSTSAGWLTVGPVAPTPVNLLDLQSSALTLGLVNLPAGKITQVRLVVDPDGDYVVPVGTTTHQPLFVPSGIESGIKILGPWEVPTCARLTVTLDFDGKNSIEYHEASRTWILRPVIRPKKHAATAISCEPEPPPPVCDVEAPCPEGQVCASGTCVAGAPLPGGSECTDGPQCLSGTCNDGLCAAGPGDASCLVSSDCLSGLSCVEAACTSSGTVGGGQGCSNGAECVSGACTAGSCELAPLNARCLSGPDCASQRDNGEARYRASSNLGFASGLAVCPQMQLA
jgi:hypothetical protein